MELKASCTVSLSLVVLHVNWNVFTGPGDDIDSIILNFVIDNGYSQLVNFETRGSNLLDVLLIPTH